MTTVSRFPEQVTHIKNTTNETHMNTQSVWSPKIFKIHICNTNYMLQNHRSRANKQTVMFSPQGSKAIHLLLHDFKCWPSQ